MNRPFLSIFYLLPVALPSFAQQTVPTPMPNLPHNQIFQTGWMPQAKTPAEYQAYVRAAHVEGAGDAEKASQQFALEYPGSELRYLLYSRVMKLYQEDNDENGVLQNGRKVLALHPDDPVALVMTSTMLAEHTRNTDPDKEAHFTQAIEQARRAINNIDTALIVPPHTPDVMVQQAKNSLLSAAHASIGLIELMRNRDTEAENELRASLEADKAEPNPLTWLRLSLAQDHNQEYEDALNSVNQALKIAGENSAVQTLARQERERLLHLAKPEGTPLPAEN